MNRKKPNGKNVDIQMTNLMLTCPFFTFSNVRLFQLYGTDYTSPVRDVDAVSEYLFYSLSHKVEIIERSKTSKTGN